MTPREQMVIDLFSTQRREAAEDALARAEAAASNAKSDAALEEALLAALHASLMAAAWRSGRYYVPRGLPALLVEEGLLCPSGAIEFILSERYRADDELVSLARLLSPEEKQRALGLVERSGRRDIAKLRALLEAPPPCTAPETAERDLETLGEEQSTGDDVARAQKLISRAERDRVMLPAARAAVNALDEAQRCFGLVTLAPLLAPADRRGALEPVLAVLTKALDGGLSAEHAYAAERWWLADLGALVVRVGSLLPRDARSDAVELALAYCRVNDEEVLVEKLGAMRRDDDLEEASRVALARTVVRAARRIRDQRKRFYKISYFARDLTCSELAEALADVYPIRFTADVREPMWALTNYAEVLPAENGRRLARDVLAQLPRDARDSDSAASALWPLLSPEERLTWLESGLDRCGDGPVDGYPPLFRHLHRGLPRALLERAWQVARRIVPPAYAPDILLAVTLALPAEIQTEALRELVDLYARNPDVPCGSPIPFEDTASLLTDAELRRALTVAEGLDESYVSATMGIVIAELARRRSDLAELEAIALKIPCLHERIAALAVLVPFAPAAERLALTLQVLAKAVELVPDESAPIDPVVDCRAHLAEDEIDILATRLMTALETLPPSSQFELLTDPVLDLLLEKGLGEPLLASLRQVPRADIDTLGYHLNLATAMKRRGQPGWEALIDEAVSLGEAMPPPQRAMLLSAFEPWLRDLAVERMLPFVFSLLRNEGDTHGYRTAIIAAVLLLFERLGGPAGVERALAVMEGVIRRYP